MQQTQIPGDMFDYKNAERPGPICEYGASEKTGDMFSFLKTAHLKTRSRVQIAGLKRHSRVSVAH